MTFEILFWVTIAIIASIVSALIGRRIGFRAGVKAGAQRGFSLAMTTFSEVLGNDPALINKAVSSILERQTSKEKGLEH